MDQDRVIELKKSMIAIGRLLWEKDLVTGLNGNISVRLDDNTILITATQTCLGLLHEKDIVVLTLDGEVVGEGAASTEKLMHTSVYKNFSETQAVIHTHTVYTNGYFLEHAKFTPRVFEAKFYLGEIQGIDQSSPSVLDAEPLMDAFERNNIIALRNHGVVARGKELFDCFILVQALEEAVKTEFVARGFMTNSKQSVEQRTENGKNNAPGKTYQLFSEDQINAIVDLVNSDAQMKELGAQTDMTMDLAVKLDETGDTFKFKFDRGNIAEVGRDDNAEFVINAPEKVWRAVFNQEIDPFVATTQKQMTLQGDFARISKWYAPCSRVFELWTQVPVE